MGSWDLFAQYERAVIGSRTRAALAVKKVKGERVGSIPFGYHLADDGRTLVEDRHEQAVIRKLAELRTQMSLRATVAHCRKHGILARDGQWWPSTIQRTLRRHRERLAVVEKAGGPGPG